MKCTEYTTQWALLLPGRRLGPWASVQETHATARRCKRLLPTAQSVKHQKRAGAPRNHHHKTLRVVRSPQKKPHRTHLTPSLLTATVSAAHSQLIALRQRPPKPRVGTAMGWGPIGLRPRQRTRNRIEHPHRGSWTLQCTRTVVIVWT